jgi:hypothetical protein
LRITVLKPKEFYSFYGKISKYFWSG